MSYNFIWEPQPSLPSQPDLFGWPGGDSDSEVLNELSNTHNNSFKSKTLNISSNGSQAVLSSSTDISADTKHEANVNPNSVSLKLTPSTTGHSGSTGNSTTTTTTNINNNNGTNNSNSNDTSCISTQKHAHTFVKKSFHRPANCHQCSDVMWGLMTVGFVCEVCNFLVHEKCLQHVFSLCTTVASTAVARPLSHCWSEQGHFKRKFCNVCRKKLDDRLAVRCEICEYHAHMECQDYVVNNCKEGAAYTPNSSLLNFKQYHHWLEGNLPPNSKCVICHKNCYPTECLTGYRCEWCGLASHTMCFKQIPIECNFGPLKNIILPPSSVCIPRTKISMESIIGVSRRSNVKSVSEDWSDEESKEESFIDKRSPKDQNEKEKHEDYAKVFDGNGSLKRRVYRYFSFNKAMSSQNVVDQCLKSFHIFGRTDEYYMCEINEKDGTEKPLDEKSNFKIQLTFDSKRPVIILRHKEANDQSRGKLKIYPGDLIYCAQVTSKYKEIPINKETTAKEVIIMAMRRFQCESLNINNFQLVEVCLDRSVTERPVSNEEYPWDIIQRLRKDSIRSLRLTRFYLKAREDPHGPGVAIFVGNLVENLNQNVYEKMLLEKLGIGNKWNSIEVIYYESGCLVLSYTCGEKAEICYEILKDTEIKDRPLMVMILPRIIPRMIPDDITPLLVFVNLKSGGCQGTQLITAFRKLLNPHQVFNLEYGGPLPGLYCFRQVKNYKILVCGGDGTVGWTLSCLDNTGQDAACNSPPIAILPLGTGNDLARVLRWGGGYTSGETPLSVLKDVVIAEELKLDRWTLVVKSDDPDKDEAKLALQLETNSLNTNEDSSILIIMNNYFGVGLDADLALDFHNARSENPNKFNSRMHNKTVYLKMGLRKMVYRTTCKDLHKQIVLEADGHIIDLPQIEGLIILNIMSWGGGANPWGAEKEYRFVKPTHYDGLLEVIGVSGMIHMGQIYSGIRNGIRICQAGHLKITLKNDLPVQVDGEPFIQSPGQITVLKSALRAIMLKKTKPLKRRKTEATSLGTPTNPSSPPANCSSTPIPNCSYKQ